MAWQLFLGDFDYFLSNFSLTPEFSDNSRHGAIPLLWYISRTTIATTSCDISNERAHYSACLRANGVLMTFYSKKRQIKDLFFHFYFLSMDILLNNELPVMKFYTDVKNTNMERTVSQIIYLKKWVSFYGFLNRYFLDFIK